VEKAALLAGFGRQHLREIPVDAEFGMQAPALQAAIDADRAAGRRPCAVVATIGTTATTAIDPVAAIAAIAGKKSPSSAIAKNTRGEASMLPFSELNDEIMTKIDTRTTPARPSKLLRPVGVSTSTPTSKSS